MRTAGTDGQHRKPVAAIVPVCPPLSNFVLVRQGRIDGRGGPAAVFRRADVRAAAVTSRLDKTRLRMGRRPIKLSGDSGYRAGTICIGGAAVKRILPVRLSPRSWQLQ